ncbi:MAG: glycosyltransferase family 4 protein [Candidatus Moraniibacteriota bacterium]
MKNVLLATRPLVPPWDEASKNFAYFLGREVRDHTLTLLTTDEGLSGVPNTVRETPLYRSGRFDFFERLRLLRYLRKMRYHFDIVHYLFTPTLLNTLLIRLLALPEGGKTVQTVATLRQDLYTDTQLKKILFADRIIVYTDASKQKIKSLGIENVERIYPGIDLQKYSPQPKFHALLQSFGIDESHFVIMYPGEYTRLGATDMLTETFVRFFQENPETNVRFFFACRVKNEKDAQKKSWVKRSFEEAGVSHFIRFTDTIADMPSLYNIADIVIFPVMDLKGKFDVPLVIIEAYACGKPVILSDLPEFREFTGNQFSVTIPRASWLELLRSMAYLRDNPEVRKQIGQAARSFVEANFDVKKTAAQYAALYASL